MDLQTQYNYTVSLFFLTQSTGGCILLLIRVDKHLSNMLSLIELTRLRIRSWRAIHYYVRTYAKMSGVRQGVRKFCDFPYVLFTIDSYEFSYVRAAHDDRIMGVVIVGVFVYFRSKTACLLICRKNVKNTQI